MIDIFKKLGEYFNPNQEEEKQEEIKVIGFYGHNGDLFIYNDWDDCFDDWSKVDLSNTAFKYKEASMISAETCMRIEGNVGDLKELTLFF